MSDNLRIIYNNFADAATLTVSSTASSSFALANIKNNLKSKPWRTASTYKANIMVNFGSSKLVDGIALPFCNLSATATIRTRGYTGTAPTISGTVGEPTINEGSATKVFDVTVNCCPWALPGLWAESTIPGSLNTYGYGGGNYARLWIPTNDQAACTSMSVEIVDTNNTNGYIEASRLIIGKSWSPKYNTSFGLSAGVRELTENIRTISGDLVSIRGPKFNTLNFDLKYMDSVDRYNMLSILKGSGLTKPLFISLFPNNSSDYSKEYAHQIYGKYNQLNNITHPVFEMYSTQVEVEEV